MDCLPGTEATQGKPPCELVDGTSAEVAASFLLMMGSPVSEAGLEGAAGEGAGVNAEGIASNDEQSVLEALTLSEEASPVPGRNAGVERLSGVEHASPPTDVPREPGVGKPGAIPLEVRVAGSHGENQEVVLRAAGRETGPSVPNGDVSAAESSTVRDIRNSSAQSQMSEVDILGKEEPTQGGIGIGTAATRRAVRAAGENDPLPGGNSGPVTVEASESIEAEAGARGPGGDKEPGARHPGTMGRETVQSGTDGSGASVFDRHILLHDNPGSSGGNGSDESTGVRSQEATLSHGVNSASTKAVPESRPGMTISHVGAAHESILDQLTDQVRWLLRADRSEAQIQLEPPELGKLRVRLSVSDASVRGVIEVENPTVHSVLQADLSKLTSALAEKGLELAQFDVLLLGERQTGGREQLAGTPEREGSGGSSHHSEESEETPDHETPRATSGGNVLDYWL